MSTRQVLLIALAIVVAAALGGLAVWQLTPQPSEPPAEQPVATPTPTPTETPEPQPAEEATVRVYLVRGEKIGVGGRTIEATEDPEELARVAVSELLAGPTSNEFEWGLGTAIPEGTTVNGVEIADGSATVDLSGTFASGGGSLSMQLRAAQVVFTLTQFDGVERVSFMLDGEPISSLGGEGVAVSAVARADFENVVPPVLVESPYPGEEITSPVTVSGTSNVFEATHQLQIVEPEGRIVYDRFVTATSGTGTRGTWSETVEFTGVTRDGFGAVIVFENSAEDGRQINIVEIPVRMLSD